MKRILLVISSVLFIACGQEEKQPLPDLPKIDVPTSLVGSYSGRLPAENAKAHQIQLELDSLGNAILTERILKDSLEIFTDTLTYRDSSGVLSFHFKESSRKLRFKKTGDLQYVFLNPTGEPFLDVDSNTYLLFRILKTGGK